MTSLLVAAILGRALVSGSFSGGGAMAVLTHSFGSQLTAQVRGEIRVISYCPDNTCEVFSAPAKTSEGNLAEFALAYLFYASGYTYLEAFVRGAGQSEAHSILDRERGTCASSDQIELASCVLQSLARRHSISVTLVRQDEGARIQTPVRLKAELAVSQLRRTEAWRSEQWRRQP